MFLESFCNLLSSSDDQGSAYELIISDIKEMRETRRELSVALEVGSRLSRERGSPMLAERLTVSIQFEKEAFA